MATVLRLLMVEDSENDMLIILRELRRGGYDPVCERVETAEGLKAALEKQSWDIILADHRLPRFSDIEALKLIREQGLDLPFIIVSGTIGEEAAVEAMKAGAHDYVMKGNLKRLVPVVGRELQEAEGRRKRKQAEEKILQAKEEWERTFDSVPDLIAIIDHQFRISRVNRALADRLDLTPKEMIGACCYDLIHGLQSPISPCPHRQVLEDGRQRYTEFYETRLGGHFSLTASPLRGIGSNQAGVIHIFRDITDRKQAEGKIIEEAEKLQKALAGIIQAMAATVEAKDPYTAGHQRRVADLAQAITDEMGLSEDQINGVRMAGVIHDLGKISVPAEILSKPTQLTEIEFSLIKVHPQTGYEILKEIEFPWPIAEMVWQHHERINGSGYPQGLKGEEILPEAKILAVADVVEAIASHRPYRPAHGIETALEEIAKQKGILFDPEVVEVCLRLFREDKFRFE
ncbi:MAG: HD domain-containing protein [Deltaproteobacteria bacterium]|nr:HD domain-containing protein [Deltaproteobacteria bacterium]